MIQIYLRHYPECSLCEAELGSPDLSDSLTICPRHAGDMAQNLYHKGWHKTFIFSILVGLSDKDVSPDCCSVFLNTNEFTSRQIPCDSRIVKPMRLQKINKNLLDRYI